MHGRLGVHPMTGGRRQCSVRRRICDFPSPTVAEACCGPGAPCGGGLRRRSFCGGVPGQPDTTEGPLLYPSYSSRPLSVLASPLPPTFLPTFPPDPCSSCYSYFNYRDWCCYYWCCCCDCCYCYYCGHRCLCNAVLLGTQLFVSNFVRRPEPHRLIQNVRKRFQ